MQIRNVKSCLHVNYKSVLCVCACVCAPPPARVCVCVCVRSCVCACVRVCARLSGDAVTGTKLHKGNAWLAYIVRGFKSVRRSEVLLPPSQVAAFTCQERARSWLRETKCGSGSPALETPQQFGCPDAT